MMSREKIDIIMFRVLWILKKVFDLLMEVMGRKFKIFQVLQRVALSPAWP